MMHSEIDIDHLAKLARIELDERVRKIFLNQLQDIVGYCSKVCEADVENLEPMVHSFSHEDNFWAEDVPEYCEDGVDFLSRNAPEMKEKQIVVPRVL
ncbi:MAG: Asp-tRNA(Asn)/Glu-tRNA(Gln) amidotransferase subunit GatC [Puniceicoccales bacterium]|jgi:aspartyl/glutamyl-tRNA(Asn/Gln) amidotransferase C subunit|nr:Asp-tRNA(Asn)/Glu-tRNA(Gln) amidotransferase subunit GatC [Puniceicoccales bacterium]